MSQAAQMCEIWMETRDHAESQNRLLQLGFLETESETELKVPDFYHGVESNTCRREGKEMNHNAILTKPQFFPWGTQELGWPFRDARSSDEGVGPLCPCMNQSLDEGQDMRGDKRNYRKEKRSYNRPQETLHSESGGRVDLERCRHASSELSGEV